MALDAAVLEEGAAVLDPTDGGTGGYDSAGEADRDLTEGGRAHGGGLAPGDGDAATSTDAAGDPLADAGHPELPADIPRVDESALAEPELDVGFVELEPFAYTYGIYANSRPEPRTTRRARLFYRFVPADQESKSKPVFVLFNGGPGSSSMLLASFGTGPMSLDPNDLTAAPQRNPSSLTQLGSLLYIDARGTGYSYMISDRPDDLVERTPHSRDADFMTSVDAADFVRVVLRVLGRQPALRNNRVVLVGESYGGMRAVTMMTMLLTPETLSTPGTWYVDTSLAAEIGRHYAAVFPEVSPTVLTPKLRAKQFGWQVLIQPYLFGLQQKLAEEIIRPSWVARTARALGITTEEILHERCPHDVSQTEAWCRELDHAITTHATSLESFELIMGTRPDHVSGLAANQRMGAYRFLSRSPELQAAPAPAAWLDALGAVPDWDAYFVRQVENQTSFFLYQHNNDTMSFLSAARFANTMVTDARWDSVVLGEAFVPALNSIVPLLTRPLFKGARYEEPEGAPVSGRILLDYGDVEGAWAVGRRVVYRSTFPLSGHAVTVGEPARFADEVRSFLQQTGL